MVGWHHRLNGHEFGWTLGVGDGQRSLVYCSPWGRKELDTTERLNLTERKRGRDLKAARDKGHSIHEGTAVPVTANFLSKPREDRGVKQHFLSLKEKNCQTRILCPANICLRNEGQMKLQIKLR